MVETNLSLFIDRELGKGLVVDEKLVTSNAENTFTHGISKLNRNLNGTIGSGSDGTKTARRHAINLERVVKGLERQGRSVKSMPGRLEAPCVIGKGNWNALESGIHLDWTSGLPNIPGAALKGVTRSFAEDLMAGEIDQEAMDINTVAAWYVQIFGIEPFEDDPGGVGDVIFFDAYFSQPRLGWEVITRHVPHGQNSPTDAIDPLPLLYLTVQPGCEAKFLLADRSRSGTSGATKLASSWLKQALTVKGIGANSKVMGRFSFRQD